MNPIVAKHKAATFTATTKQAIKADENGIVSAPSRIQLIKAGVWEDSNKGSLTISIPDLLEMKNNFDNGVGLPDGGSGGAPFDYSHNDWEKAAGWIKELEVVDDILYASEIEWTPAAQKAIADGEWKFISPSFYPGCLGYWQDPEDFSITAKNVFLGCALTNIPFFKKLTGLISASQSPQGNDDESRIYITSKGEQMELETVRKIEASKLSDEQKTFLAEHKDELTKDERVSFGFDTAEVAAPVVTASTVSQEDGKILASIKSGEMKLVKASDYDGLNAQVQASAKALEDIKRDAIKQKVTAAATAGKFATDKIDVWTNRVMADATVMDDIDAMHVDPVLASEIGKQGGNTMSAAEQIRAKAGEKVTASREANAEISMADAISEVRRENAELAAAYDAEVKK